MKPKVTDHHVRSAIKGMVRMGATPGEISHELNLDINHVKALIKDFKPVTHDPPHRRQ